MYLWPFPGNEKISADFNQPRPLGGPYTRIHGAVDVPGSVGDLILAPEAGSVMAMKNHRPADQEGMAWPDERMSDYPFCNYFYDMYGSIVILHGNSGRSYIFSHSYWNQIRGMDWVDRVNYRYTEQGADGRWPFFSDFTNWTTVSAGAKIAKFGMAGFTTGCHCHFEIHPSYNRYHYPDRIDPEEVRWNGR